MPGKNEQSNVFLVNFSKQSMNDSKTTPTNMSRQNGKEAENFSEYQFRHN